mgnify:CR=1 FL=1
MREARYLIDRMETIEQDLKPALKKASAAFRRWYAFTDVIYLPPGVSGELLNARYVRWRITHATGQDWPVITVTDKKIVWRGDVKEDIILFRREFDAAQPAIDFVDASYGWEKQFAFSRTGTEYALGTLRIFVEDILVPGIRWSVEIEGPDETAIAACSRMLGLGDPIRDSVPSLVYRHTCAQR